jgi:hypothetical protein
MGWFFRRRKDKPTYVVPTLEEMSSGLQESLRTVQAAIEKCEGTQGEEFVQAWRGLHIAMRVSVGTLDLLLGEAPSPRVQRMVRLTAMELWDMAERYLVAHVPATAEDMATLRGAMWERAEAARANHVETRGDRAAQDRLRRLANQVDAGVAALDDPTAADWQAAAEVRRFMNLALG